MKECLNNWGDTLSLLITKGFPGGSVEKNLSANAGDRRCRCHPCTGKIPWRRKWQPTLVLFLPGEFHRQRSLAGYSLYDCKESDMVEHTETRIDYKTQ